MGTSTKFSAELVIPTVLDIIDRFDCFEVCGSLRRRLPMVGDIDLVSRRGIDDVTEMLATFDWIPCETNVPRTKFNNHRYPFPLDVWTGPDDTFGSRVLHATGSGLHNSLMRKWSFDRHGISVTWRGAHSITSGERLDDGTEDGIRHLVGWPIIAPCDREIDIRNIPSWLDGFII